jgi:hypothetical protein
MRTVVFVSLAFGFAGSVCAVRVGAQDKAAPGAAKEERRFSGELTAKSPFDKVRKGRYCVVQEVSLAPKTTYQIDLRSSAFDAYLRLEDSQGKQLAEDDDSGGGFNARLIFTTPDRTDVYRMIVTSFLPEETGAYELTIREVGKLQLIGLANAVQGQLTASDPLDPLRVGRRYRAHQVPLTEGKKYQIDLESKEFDAYLRLEDGRGRVLDEDDDGGGGRNARLVFIPQRTQTYRFIVTTYLPGETGAYLFTIRELPESPRRAP